MSSPSSIDTVSTRLTSVEGYSGLKNDIVFVKARSNAETDNSQTLVFFGGDVQDYTENMLRHRDNRRYVDWNLESTAVLLSQSFPHHDVMAIKGSGMYLNTFVCYENFLSCNRIGVPDSVGAGNALSAHRHLLELVRRTYELVDDDPASRKVEQRLSHSESRDQLQTGTKPPGVGLCRSTSLTLVGFSKGCVVLNRLVRELHGERLSRSESMSDFLSKTTDIYWLDSGHSGGSDVWITDAEVLKSLADAGIRLHVHVTPYQLDDHRRPWIRKEEKLFNTTLLKMNANINRVLHFGDKEPSIESHFGVLRVFKSQPHELVGIK